VDPEEPVGVEVAHEPAKHGVGPEREGAVRARPGLGDEGVRALVGTELDERGPEHGPERRAVAPIDQVAFHGPMLSCRAARGLQTDSIMGTSDEDEPRFEHGELLLKGALMGIIASIVMGCIGVAVAAIKGPEYAIPVSVVTAALFPALRGASFVIVGGILHMTVGAAFGALFAFLLPKTARVPSVLGAGLFYGLLLHLVTVYGVLWELSIVRGTSRVDTWWYLAEHVAYGLATGIMMASWLSAARSERVLAPELRPPRPAR
jgi:hypothetical protein